MVGMGVAPRLLDWALRDHGEFDVFGLLIRRNRSKASWALAATLSRVRPPAGVMTARRLRWFMPAKSDPAELGDVEPLADSTARQARRVVAAYATDADECRVFLSMLGIGPGKLEA